MLVETGHFIVWESDHLSSGNLTTYPGICDISWEMGHSTLWERFFSYGNRTTYPLGIRSIILWVSGHPLGNGTCGTLFSGIRTTYPLESLINRMRAVIEVFGVALLEKSSIKTFCLCEKDVSRPPHLTATLTLNSVDKGGV